MDFSTFFNIFNIESLNTILNTSILFEEKNRDFFLFFFFCSVSTKMCSLYLMNCAFDVSLLSHKIF